MSKKMDLNDVIFNKGTIDKFEPINLNNFNFTKLDSIIHDCDVIQDEDTKFIISKDNTNYLEKEKYIILNEDFSLDNHEIDFFEGGIELDIDGLTIDGKSHFIDAKTKTSIFIITAKNVTLKNIVFKRGHVINDKFDNHIFGGGAIKIVKNASLILENCTFLDNSSDDDGGAILNNGKLSSFSSIFNFNSSKGYGGAICNNKIFISKKDSYNNNKSKIGGAIYNLGNLILENDIIFLNNDSDFHQDIFNANLIRTEHNYDLDKVIFNTGDINKRDVKSKSFTYLNDKILNLDYREVIDLNKISLDCDIVFNPIDDLNLKNGFKIQKELIIDGNGHSIDGNLCVPLFNINQKVIFKNVIFKNAYSNTQPIFLNNSIVEFENCKFINNKSGGNCSIIKNNKNLKLSNSFVFNNTSENGFIIENNGEIIVLDSCFINNYLNFNGSCIKNNKNNTIEIKNSKFKSNYSNGRGGVFYNDLFCLLKIEFCEFKNNASNIDGGAIFNIGEIILNNSHFIENTSKENGGAIFVNSGGILTIKYSKFINNSSMNSGGAISNFGDILLNYDIFKDNFAFNSGGAISNQARMKTMFSIFEYNTVETNVGGAIINFGDITSDNTNFNSNKAINGGGAILNKGLLKINLNSFKTNMANSGGAIGNYGQCIFRDSVFEENQAKENGGALNNQKNGNIESFNSKFVRNIANSGGAIWDIYSGFAIHLYECYFDYNMPNDILEDRT